MHPRDNRFPQFDAEIAALTDLSDEERRELQREVDELTAVLTLGRDYRG